MSFNSELIRGIWRENPLFVIVLGTCPTLAVSTSVENGIGMGIAATFVLVCSNIVVAAVRKLVPDSVRIAVYIVMIKLFPILSGVPSRKRPAPAEGTVQA